MRIYTPHIFYETPGGAAGAGTATPPGAPGASGQGPQPNGFRQTFFSNVPDEQWAVMEPHLAGVNRHVTQLEQQAAAFRGYTPQQVQGLATFARTLTSDPYSAWEKLTRQLQQRGVIDPNLDVDHLVGVAARIGVNDEPGTDMSMEPGQIQQAGDMPPWAQQLFQLVEEFGTNLQALQQARETDQRTAAERRQDAALKATIDSMRTKLKEAGVPDSLIGDDNRLKAALLVHGGNVDAAVQSETNYRNETLKGYVQNKTDPTSRQRQQPIELPEGDTPPRERQTRDSDDPFVAQRGAAEQFVASQLAQQAQGG